MASGNYQVDDGLSGNTVVAVTAGETVTNTDSVGELTNVTFNDCIQACSNDESCLSFSYNCETNTCVEFYDNNYYATGVLNTAPDPNSVVGQITSF